MNQDKQFLALERTKNEFEIIGEALTVDNNERHIAATFRFHPESQTQVDLKQAHNRRKLVAVWLLEPTFEDEKWTGFREVERVEGYISEYGVNADNGREMRQTITVTKIQR